MKTIEKAPIKTKRLYFAYGSNMDLEQMHFRCPKARPLKTARLENHKFLINPRGVASIIESPDHHVEGLLWELTEECEASLDVYESVAAGHYVKQTVKLKGFEDEDDILVYVASDQTPSYTPRDGYFEKILRAAKAAGLSDPYIESLQKYFDQCQGRRC